MVLIEYAYKRSKQLQSSTILTGYVPGSATKNYPLCLPHPSPEKQLLYTEPYMTAQPHPIYEAQLTDLKRWPRKTQTPPDFHLQCLPTQNATRQNMAQPSCSPAKTMTNENRPFRFS
jgi:hypothetical protein